MRALLTVLTVLVLVPLAGAQGLGGEVRHLEHGDVARDYYLFVPPGLRPGAPLLVVLHGRGGTGQGTALLTGFDDVAAANGFVVAYPDGLDGQWNYVEGIDGYDLEADDVGFLRDLAATLVDELGLDPRRVFVAGFSNGGYMAQRLACSARDVFAGFATVAAAGYAGLPTVCGHGAPVSVLMVHGTDDAVVPFGGLLVDTPQGRVTLLASVQQTLSFWAAYAGCDANAERRPVAPTGRSPGTEAAVFSVTGCPEGHAVELVVVTGGGHNWPGRPGHLPPEVAGRVNEDLNASEYAWRFFSRLAPLAE